MYQNPKNNLKFHLLQPDYGKPVYKLPEKYKNRILNRLSLLYGDEQAQQSFIELERILKVYYAHKTPEMVEWEKKFIPKERFTEKDAILITYGDLICNDGDKPLETMAEFCHKYLRGVFNTLHILPFFPYSSDRGFSVMDFEEVDPNLGNWDDILNLKNDFYLMFDGVFNHVSSQSRWFQEFLNQNPDYKDFFTVFSTKEKISADHLKLIVRPRTSDVLTSFSTLNGPCLVWTTFSADQIDLNYHNPKVLLKMIEILLTYVRRGADIIRLDAVTYLWEELGTTCVHLDQSHESIKLFRDVLDAVAPHVALITETNVQHKDNIRYFGNGYDEAQMIYNFALPPLVLHSFQTGNAAKLTAWAGNLEKIADQATYFNFLDSHDGIGVMAVKNILTREEIEIMALKVIEHGGFISYKADDGTEIPYELNITWYSAINREDSDDSRALKIKRYLASRSISLVMMGVPGIYLHGLLGSKNDADAVLEERQTRSINRDSLKKKELISAFEDTNSNICQIASSLIRMLRKRIREKSFHPNAAQNALNISDSVFCVNRVSVDEKESVLAVTNITDSEQLLNINLNEHGLPDGTFFEIFSETEYEPDNGKLTLSLKPYDVFWLKSKN